MPTIPYRLTMPLGEGRYFTISKASLRNMGRDLFDLYGSKRQNPIVRPNAHGFLSSLGVRINDPTESLVKVRLSRDNAVSLYEMMVARNISELDLPQGALSYAELRQHLSGHSLPFIDTEDHLRNVLSEIWAANLDGSPLHGIDILEFGTRYTSGIGTYLLAEELAGLHTLGLSNRYINVKIFYRMLAEAVNSAGSSWNMQNLHFNSCAISLTDFIGIRTFLANYVGSNGIEAMINEYGSLRGMVALAAQYGDMNLGYVFSVLGTQERLKEALNLPEDTDLAGWSWKSINLTSRSMNALLTQLETEAEESGWQTVINRHGSLRGMVALAAQYNNMHLAQLFSAFGTREKLKELLRIPDDVDLEGWKWNQIGLPSESLNNLLVHLETEAGRDGWPAVISRYGSLRGMISLAAYHDDMHLAIIYTAIGSRERLKELLNIPDDVSLDDWKWTKISMPSKSFNALLVQMETEAASDGWPAVISRHGTLRGMVALAAHNDDMNLQNLFSAIGTPERLKELLKIPDNVSLDDWKWKQISLSSRSLNNLLTQLEAEAKSNGWQAVIDRHGSLRGMLSLACQHDNMHLAMLFSALGPRAKMRELLNIPDDVDLDGWKWQCIELGSKELNEVLGQIEKEAVRDGWETIIRRYGSLRGMIALAAQNNDMNPGQLFSAIGTPERLKELLNIPDDVNLDTWRWKSVDLPSRSFNNLIKQLDSEAARDGWPAVILRHGSLNGMIALAAQHGEMNLADLFSAIGTRESLKELLNIPDDVNLDGWKWRFINLPSGSAAKLLSGLRAEAERDGWDAVISRYGSLRGMVTLAAQNEGMNLAHLFSAIGTRGKMKELLNIPDDVNLDGWKWKMIGLPGRSLNNLLTQLETEAARDGWQAVIARHGSLRGMIELAGQHDDMNPGSLFSAIGDKDNLRELLNIPDSINLDNWKWQAIDIPLPLLNKLVADLNQEAARDGWPVVISRYGSLRGMIALGAQYGDMSPYQLFTAIGTRNKLKALLNIPDDIRLDNWKWSQISINSKALNGLLTQLETEVSRDGWPAVIARHGSLRGMVALAAQHDDMNLGNLFSAIGTQSRLRGLLGIPEDVSLDDWKWRSIHQPSRSLNALLTQLSEEAARDGWDAVISRHGTVRGMISLAAQHDDMNLGNLFSAIGTQDKLRELLSIPEDINIDGWKWTQICLTSRSLNRLLTKIETEAARDGWPAVISRYGSLNGMIALAAQHDDMNLGMLFQAIGTKERLRELLSIPENVCLDSWKWKQIELPSKALNNLLAQLNAEAERNGWQAVISKYGSLNGMIALAAQHDDMNLGNLYSAIGTQERLKELLNIPDGVSFDDWKWKQINLSSISLNDLLTQIGEEAISDGWQAVISRYSSLRGMISLAAQNGDMNIFNLFSAIGTPERLREMLNIPREIDLSEWKWSSINLSSKSLNDLLVQVETEAAHDGWPAVIARYGSLKGMICLSAQHDDMNLGQLYSALGPQDKLKKLLVIPESVNLDGWKWTRISIPGDTMRKYIAYINSQTATRALEDILLEVKSADASTREAKGIPEISESAIDDLISLTRRNPDILTAYQTDEEQG